MALNHLEGVRNPLPSSKGKFYVLIETTGSNQLHDKAKLDAFLENCLENSLIVDGSVAQDYNQIAAFWRIREGITEALGRAGAVYQYDLIFNTYMNLLMKCARGHGVFDTAFNWLCSTLLNF